ncbi:MAG: putative Ig domain-containing protein, partial [Bacteroidota bacterium]|nr:putative Ig domain-containing protein [Bacteroidota bacterium]
MMKKLTKLFLVLILAVLCSSGKKPVPEVIYFTDWKFKLGDNLDWAKPDFNDADWENQLSGIPWEGQGHPGYDGYAWYRKSFNLPKEMLDQAFFKDSLEIQLGKVDDTEETYLNGHLLGKNGVLVKENDKTKFENDPLGYSKQRFYIISSHDKRVLWGKRNTISVRVHDNGGNGGFTSANMFLSLRDLKDYIVIDDVKSGLQLNNNKYSKTIYVSNKSTLVAISGKFKVTVDDANTGKNYFSKSWDIKLKAGALESYNLELKDVKDARLVAKYTFLESKGKCIVIQSQDFPYILTPKPGDSPKINGAKVFGVRPGSPFLFRIPTTGIRPIRFTAENLPEGLTLDSSTGIITGKVSKAGEYNVTLIARNAKGENKREFRIVVGDKLALTPPMGWNSWNVWGLAVDNDKVKASADMFIKSGLADQGYTYVNIDDGWEAPSRDPNGEMVTNEK